MTNIYGIKKTNPYFPSLLYYNIVSQNKGYYVEQKRQKQQVEAKQDDVSDFYNDSIIEHCCFPKHFSIPFYVDTFIGGNGDKYFHQQKFDKMYYNNSYTFTVSLYTGYGFNWLFVFYTK